ncbi:oligosaccharide flippase family protein [Flavobacteriales bacterium]|nr:oligosaccharide flippase family protein [Flavobacteriales bacterium]
MNPLKKLLGQTAIYGLSSIVGRLLNFLLVPLYTRYFTTVEYGETTILYAYVAFFVVILTYGMETAFFRFSHLETDKKKVYSTTLLSILVSSAMFMLVACFFSQEIANAIRFGDHPEYIKYFALIIGLDAISSISFAKLRQQNKAIRFALIRLLNIFINIGLNLFFIIYCDFAIENDLQSASFIEKIYNPEIGIGYIFIANLVASIVTIILLLPEMFGNFKSFDKLLWKKMLIYASPLMIAGLAGIANETIDRIILQYLLPADVATSEIGIYSAFYKLSIIMTLFVQTFRFAAEPFFFAQEKEKNSKELYARVLKYFTIVTSIIFLGSMLYFDIIKNFIGSEFQDPRGKIVVSILLFANLFLGIYYNLSVWYKLSERTKYGAYLSIFGALLTVVFNFMLIPSMGFEGAAWATLICYFSMTVASYILSKKYYPIPYPVVRICFYLAFSFGLYLFSTFTDMGMTINSIYLFVFIGVVILLEKPKKRVISNP